MKLQPRARAAITVGPGCCKDKLMQAAGRMRQLDRGQGAVARAEEVLHRRAVAALLHLPP